jgi:hypothetical protein
MNSIIKTNSFDIIRQEEDTPGPQKTVQDSYFLAKYPICNVGKISDKMIVLPDVDIKRYIDNHIYGYVYNLTYSMKYVSVLTKSDAYNLVRHIRKNFRNIDIKYSEDRGKASAKNGKYTTLISNRLRDIQYDYLKVKIPEMVNSFNAETDTCEKRWKHISELHEDRKSMTKEEFYKDLALIV